MKLGIATFVAGACGFIALSYEILWYRLYAFVSWGAPAAFGALLGFYLLGTALGSFAFRSFCTGREARPRRLLGLIATLLFLANAASYLVAPALGRLATFCPWFWSLGLVAVATCLLGGVFPLVAHFGIEADDDAGAGLSYVYVANIVGSTAGCLLTGFVATNVWSTRTLGTLLALAGLFVFALVLLTSARGAALVLGLVAAAGCSALIVAVSPRLFDQLYERLLFKKKFTPDIRFAETVENRSGIINVTADGRVWGQGAYDGAFNTSLVWDRNWIVRAYAVSAMRPALHQMLMIGLASGSWAQVLAHAPSLDKLTIVEINPGYLEIILRHPDVASILSNPKVDIVIDDGRRWLQRHPNRTFDAIVMNTSYHWRAHSTNLLSSEFLELARAHLSPGGLLYYNTTSSDDVYKTAATSFPFALRIINFIAVSDAPLTLDPDTFAPVLKAYRIDGAPALDLSKEEGRHALDAALDLARSLSSKPEDYSLESRESLLARTAAATVVTDDNMAVEWRQRFPEVEP